MIESLRIAFIGHLTFILSKNGIITQEGKNCYWEQGWKILHIMLICGFPKVNPTRQNLIPYNLCR